MKDNVTSSTIDLNLSFYENYKANRRKGMIAGAKLKRTIISNFNTSSYTDAANGSYDGMSVKQWFQDNINNDRPNCSVEDAILDNGEAILDGLGEVQAGFETVENGLSDLGSSVNDGVDDVGRALDPRKWF